MIEAQTLRVDNDSTFLRSTVLITTLYTIARKLRLPQF